MDGYKECTRCFGSFPPSFFHLTNTRSCKPYRRSVCVGCLQTGRDYEKQRNRFRVKARNTIRSHAARLKISKEELTKKFGWTIDRVEHLMRHAWENTCAYCWRPFKELPHGLADLTIDVIDPFRDPHVETNTTICCSTCNKEKQRTPPGEWSEKLRSWRIWKDNQKNGLLPLWRPT